MKGPPEDPRGLIQDAYAMEGIGAPECRSIFLDWALGLPEGRDVKAEVRRLLTRHAGPHPDHPMTAVLLGALDRVEGTGRRGGRSGRVPR